MTPNVSTQECAGFLEDGGVFWVEGGKKAAGCGNLSPGGGAEEVVTVGLEGVFGKV